MGRGGGSSKPKSWVLNDAIEDALRQGTIACRGLGWGGVRPFWTGRCRKSTRGASFADRGPSAGPTRSPIALIHCRSRPSPR